MQSLNKALTNKTILFSFSVNCYEYKKTDDFFSVPNFKNTVSCGKLHILIINCIRVIGYKGKNFLNIFKKNPGN